MFSTLASLTELAGISVLDLYAGSGALGLEALSRGAAAATFVESDPVAARLIADNAAHLGLAGARVATEALERFLRQAAPGTSYGLVLADPPYELPAGTLAGQLARLAADRIAGGGIVVVERSSRDPEWVWPPPLTGLRVRRYGAGTLWYGRRP